jgi:hypothetical protein
MANLVFSCSFPPCDVFRKHWRMADSALPGLPPIAHFKQSQGVARCEPEASGKMSWSGLLSKSVFKKWTGVDGGVKSAHAIAKPLPHGSEG